MINTLPYGLPTHLPGFVVDACKKIKVRAEKINGAYKATKAALIEGVKGKEGKRFLGYAVAAEYLAAHPELKDEIEIPATACVEVE